MVYRRHFYFNRTILGSERNWGWLGRGYRHVIEFRNFQLQRNHCSQSDIFIYMKIHLEYRSTSAKCIRWHNCHERHLTRLCRSICYYYTAFAYYILPNVSFGKTMGRTINTIVNNRKLLCIVPYENRKRMCFVFTIDSERNRYIRAGKGSNIIDPKSNAAVALKIASCICRSCKSAQNKDCAEQHSEKFSHLYLLLFLYQAALGCLI